MSIIIYKVLYCIFVQHHKEKIKMERQRIEELLTQLDADLHLISFLNRPDQELPSRISTSHNINTIVKNSISLVENLFELTLSK